MDANEGAVQTVHYGRLFPWVHLFRAFRIAIDFRKMILGGFALVALAAGSELFLNLLIAPQDQTPAQRVQWPWEMSLGVPRPLEVPRAFLDDPRGTLLAVGSYWRLALLPIRSIVEPARVLFATESGWPELAYAWTQLLWAVIVWAFFGGAITRMAAVQFARDEKVGMRAALGFAIRKFPSFLAAPLLPLFGIGLFWLICLLGGLVGRVPYAGDAIVGALFFVALGLGLIMALILFGVAPGWPLMFAAISAEGSDGFDAFSRSYSYVYSRPWHYLWYAVVAMVYGAAVIFFVSLAATLLVYLAGWGLASGMGFDRATALFVGAPEIVGGPALLGAVGDGSIPTGSMLVGVWLHVLAVVVVGFVPSFFWTAATIVYFLLRRSDDATELDEVFLSEEQDRDELLPLVGVAKSDQPLVVRPPAQTDELDTSGEAQIYSGDTELDIRPDDAEKKESR
jgi:hypothetical protein